MISETRPFIVWNYTLKIVTKPLQIKRWLLQTAYKKLPGSYQMVPSPNPYDIPFSHNTTQLAYHSAL